MKIKEQYSNKIIELTNDIDSSIKRLGFVVYHKISLKKEEQNLIQKIQNLNQEKETLVQQIYEEYGNGYIDPGTWQFIPTEEKIDESEEHSVIQEN